MSTSPPSTRSGVADAAQSEKLLRSLPSFLDKVTSGELPEPKGDWLNTLRRIFRNKRSQIEAHYTSVGRPSPYDNLPPFLDPSLYSNPSSPSVAHSSRMSSPAPSNNSNTPTTGGMQRRSSNQATNPNANPVSNSSTKTVSGNDTPSSTPIPSNSNPLPNSSPKTNPSTTLQNPSEPSPPNKQVLEFFIKRPLPPLAQGIPQNAAIQTFLNGIKCWADVQLLEPDQRNVWFKLTPGGESKFAEVLAVMSKAGQNASQIAIAYGNSKHKTVLPAGVSRSGSPAVGASSSASSASNGGVGAGGGVGTGGSNNGIAGMAPRPAGVVAGAGAGTGGAGAGGQAGGQNSGMVTTGMPLPNMTIPVGAIRNSPAGGSSGGGPTTSQSSTTSTSSQVRPATTTSTAPNTGAGSTSSPIPGITKEVFDRLRQLTDEQGKLLRPDLKAQFDRVKTLMASLNAQSGSASTSRSNSPAPQQPRPPTNQVSNASNGQATQSPIPGITLEVFDKLRFMTEEQASSLSPEAKAQFDRIKGVIATMNANQQAKRQQQAQAQQGAGGGGAGTGGNAPTGPGQQTTTNTPAAQIDLTKSPTMRAGPSIPSGPPPPIIRPPPMRPPPAQQQQQGSVNKQNINDKVKEIMAAEGGISAVRIRQLYQDAHIQVTETVQASIEAYIRSTIARGINNTRPPTPPPPPISARDLAVERVQRMLTEQNDGVPMSEEMANYYTDVAEDLYKDHLRGALAIQSDFQDGEGGNIPLQMKEVALYAQQVYGVTLPDFGLEPGFGIGDISAKRKADGVMAPTRAKRLRAMQKARLAQDSARNRETDS